MRALSWLPTVPFLLAATCSPTPYGGALEEITIHEKGPLLLDGDDERLTDTPPVIEIVLTRDSDGGEATSELPLSGSLAAGFSLSDDRSLELPAAPCEDTRVMSARFRVVPAADWGEGATDDLSEETAQLHWAEDSVAELTPWERWSVTLTPAILFPTERVHRDDLPLECWER